jgi:hypothetical protein
VSGELRVASEAVDRADLGEQLGRGDGGAAEQLEQRGRDLGGACLQLLLELGDRPVERANGRDELTGDPHLAQRLRRRQAAAARASG